MLDRRPQISCVFSAVSSQHSSTSASPCHPSSSCPLAAHTSHHTDALAHPPPLHHSLATCRYPTPDLYPTYPLPCSPSPTAPSAQPHTHPSLSRRPLSDSSACSAPAHAP